MEEGKLPSARELGETAGTYAAKMFNEMFSEAMDKKEDIIEVLVKAITIIEGMASREYEPMSLAEITEKSGLDKTGIYRILKTLEARGWAEQTEDKSWRLTPRFIRFAEDYRLGRDRYFRKLDERDRNYLGRM